MGKIHNGTSQSLDRTTRSSRRTCEPNDNYGVDSGSRKKRKSLRDIPEEEIAAYVWRKALRVGKKLKSQTVAGYLNTSNPFGDSNLNERFVWKKKMERDIEAEKKRQKQRMAEIEKVRKRREERALEKSLHEEDGALLALERARAVFQGWEKGDGEFHFNQTKLRPEIRLREGHAKPIDILTGHLNGLSSLNIELNDPCMVFKGLTVKDTEELRDDINMHLDSDTEMGTRVEYWNAALLVCDFEIGKARRKDALDRARVHGEEPAAELLAEERGVHDSIITDVRDYLLQKTYKELENIHSSVKSWLGSGTAKVVEFWEVVLKQISICKANAFLKETSKHLQRLKQHIEEDGPEHDDTRDISQEPMVQEETTKNEEETGSLSHLLLHGDDNEEAISPGVDRAALERRRLAVIQQR
ncbi:cactin-like [Punica granatum]|uniref:Cactin-like n=1 Tax=Punica granatum TaxID=22663 RepID=A0A6P8EHJ0_PUNGR|nr:cactin-like [Punica granatum]